MHNMFVPGPGFISSSMKMYNPVQGMDVANGMPIAEQGKGKKVAGKYSKAGRDAVSKKISHLVKKEKVPQKQAVAMAHNMMSKKGYKVPVVKNKKK